MFLMQIPHAYLVVSNRLGFLTGLGAVRLDNMSLWF